MIYIREEYQAYFDGMNRVQDYFAIEGKVYKKIKNRQTLRFQRGDKNFFIKCHSGVGYWEIIKNIAKLQLPVLTAKTEWIAIERLKDIGVTTLELVGYGVTGLNPARRRSFIITLDFGPNISLESLAQMWSTTPPDITLKRTIIRKVAEIARRLHANGLNHRDFYLPHFLLKLSGGAPDLDESDVSIGLIDLHRVQIRNKTPRSWVIKDLGGLYFSSMDARLTKRDLFHFIKAYSGRSLKQLRHPSDIKFWENVKKRAVRLYNSHNR